jgi:hypothetical protein
MLSFASRPGGSARLTVLTASPLVDPNFSSKPIAGRLPAVVPALWSSDKLAVKSADAFAGSAVANAVAAATSPSRAFA